MTRPNRNAFLLKIALALSGCQLVEQALKLYIAEALDLVRSAVGDKVPFKMSGGDYENYSLGKLIETFKKLSDADTKLIKDLHEFRKKRNRLSHTGIVNSLNPDQELDYSGMSEYEDELSTIEPEAKRLWYEITMKSAVLGFEDLTKDV